MFASILRHVFEIRDNLQFVKLRNNKPMIIICYVFRIIDLVTAIGSISVGIHLLFMDKFIASKLIIPLIAVICLVSGELIVRLKIFSPKWENAVHSFLHTMWHILAFISLVIATPENTEFYPMLY